MFNPFYSTEILKYILGYVKYKDHWILRMVNKKINILLKKDYEYLLYDYQRPHVRTVIDKLEKWPAVRDGSLMGFGKTPSTFFVLKYLFEKKQISHILWVSPKNGTISINKFINKFFPDILTEESDDMTIEHKMTVRLNKKNAPSFKHLTYTRFAMSNDFIKHKGSDYESTKLWKQYCKDGVVVVFDECHALKNDSNRYNAALVLLDDLYKSFNKNQTVKSVAYFITGTVSDKPDQIPRYCKLWNIQKSSKLGRYDIQSGYVAEGIQEIFDFCDIDDRKRAWARIENATDRSKITQDLFTYYVVPKITVTGIDILQYRVEQLEKELKENKGLDRKDAKNKCSLIIQKNIYYKTDEKSGKVLKAKLDQLYKTANDKKAAFAKITADLEELEIAKCQYLLPNAIKRKLKEGRKVIVMLSFLKSAEKLAELLKKHNPLRIYGETKDGERIDNINKFNHSGVKYIQPITIDFKQELLKLLQLQTEYKSSGYIVKDGEWIKEKKKSKEEVKKCKLKIEEKGYENEIEVIKQLYRLDEYSDLKTINDWKEYLLKKANKKFKKENKEIIKIKKDDDEYNLLICSLTATNSCISLDDQVGIENGGKPRTMFIIPNHRLIEILQAQWRIYRSDTKSDAEIIFPYFYTADDVHTPEYFKELEKQNKHIEKNIFEELDNNSFDNDDEIVIREERPICGAQTKLGKPCKNKAKKGYKKCAKHITEDDKEDITEFTTSQEDIKEKLAPSEYQIFKKEENILTSLAKKSKFMKKLTSKVLKHIKFPNEYEFEVE